MAVDGVLLEWGETLADAAGSEWFDTWVALFGDPLLRRLVLRFLLCRAALALHHAFSNQSELQPTCFPPFPEACPVSKLQHPTCYLGSTCHTPFRDPCITPPRPGTVCTFIYVFG